MIAHTTAHLLMVRPAQFGPNPQTAESNAFQAETVHSSPNYIQEQALAEFDGFVALLRQHGVTVNLIQDTPEPEKPDAIFPNNWLSLHHNGDVILYPLEAPNRRHERRSGILELLERGYRITAQHDLTHWEEEGVFLESTGSMIFDHPHKIGYAALSSRTQSPAIQDFEKKSGYRILSFDAQDESGQAIYHTNVLMCLGQDFVVICKEAIPDPAHWQRLEKAFTDTQKDILDITMAQLYAFAGNMLEITNAQQERLLVISEQAYQSLDEQQRGFLQARCRLLTPPLYTIERYGGGSARCMLAEVFLPPKPLRLI